MSQQRENPLAGNQGASKISTGDNKSLPAAADFFSGAALYVAGALVVVVDTGHGKHRRRVYFNLPSAQRAADRAIEAGHDAEIVLCRIVPVTGGGDDD